MKSLTLFFLFLNLAKNFEFEDSNQESQLLPNTTNLLDPFQIVTDSQSQNLELSLKINCKQDYKNFMQIEGIDDLCSYQMIDTAEKINKFVKTLKAKVTDSKFENSIQIQYTIQPTDQSQLGKVFTQKLSLCKSIPIQLNDTYLYIKPERMNEETRKILEVQNSYLKNSSIKNLKVEPLQGSIPSWISFVFQDNFLNILLEENTKLDSLKTFTIQLEDLKTGLKSENVQITLQNPLLSVNSDFAYRAIFLMSLFIFTLIILMIVITLSNGYQLDNKKNEQPQRPIQKVQKQYVLEGTPVDSQVLTDSIIMWKTEHPGNETTGKGGSLMLDSDEEDPGHLEYTQLKESDAFQNIEEMSAIDSDDKKSHKSFFEDIHLK